MRHYGQLFQEIKARYDKQPTRDPELICAQGFHLNCDVLKLRKRTWTNDDPTKINNPNGGIFFSIWITDEGAISHRAEFNIHAYYLPKLTNYRIGAKDFCQQFRIAFNKLHSDWPNVSTDFGSMTLMQGWFHIHEKTFTRDVLALMKQFEPVASIIDDLLKQRVKAPKRGSAQSKNFV